VNDTDGNQSTCDWYTSYDNSAWTWRQTNSSILNATISYNYSQANTQSTVYYWKVNANDGNINISSNYSFTTVANASVESWQPISFTINGTCYNLTIWRNIPSGINGTAYNTTTWRNIPSGINGTCYNITTWINIPSGINGTCYNITTWSNIPSGINGTCYNLTIWTNIPSGINGSCYNYTKQWRTIDSNINGICYNTTIKLITFGTPYPDDNSFNIPLQPTAYIQINQTNGQKMNISWYYGTILGNESILLDTQANITNNTITTLFYPMKNKATKYFWRIQADDGTNYYNQTYNFQTEGYPGGIGTNIPNNGASIGVALAAIIFGLLAFLILIKKRE
jgi:hypothetical protein